MHFPEALVLYHCDSGHGLGTNPSCSTGGCSCYRGEAESARNQCTFSITEQEFATEVVKPCNVRIQTKIPDKGLVGWHKIC